MLLTFAERSTFPSFDKTGMRSQALCDISVVLAAVHVDIKGIYVGSNTTFPTPGFDMCQAFEIPCC